MTTVHLPEWPRQIVSRLANRRGVRVWAIGGVVRDALLGRGLHDWDFASDGDALGLARSVADALNGAYFPLDEKRSTGRAIVRGLDGEKVELDFAALRGGSLEADLLARDFSVNAMALSSTGRLIDPTGGRDDLIVKRLRATSEHAFKDDPVRLMRAVRLEFELEFEIDPSTEALARRDAPLLGTASAERLRDELVRLVVPLGARRALERLDDLGLLPHLLPEFGFASEGSGSPPHLLDAWRHALETLDALEVILDLAQRPDAHLVAKTGVPAAVADELRITLRRHCDCIAHHLAAEVSAGRDRRLLLKLSALLHDISRARPPASSGENERLPLQRRAAVSAGMAATRLRALRFSSGETTRVRTIIGCQDQLSLLTQTRETTRRAVYRYFRATGSAGIDVVLLSLAAHLAACEPRFRQERWHSRLEVGQTLLMHYFERFHETIAPPRVVTGHDLMSELGIEPGPEIGHLVEGIREAQAAGEVSTRREALELAAHIQETRSKNSSETSCAASGK